MNPFKVLGISENSTEAERKKAYRKLCALYHPDNNGGNAEKFEEVTQAWGMIHDKRPNILNSVASNKILEHIDLFHFRVVTS